MNKSSYSLQKTVQTVLLKQPLIHLIQFFKSIQIEITNLISNLWFSEQNPWETNLVNCVWTDTKFLLVKVKCLNPKVTLLGKKPDWRLSQA